MPVPVVPVAGSCRPASVAVGRTTTVACLEAAQDLGRAVALEAGDDRDASLLAVPQHRHGGVAPPLPVTAELGRLTALSRSAVTTSTDALMPGLTPAVLRSSANVTL